MSGWMFQPLLPGSAALLAGGAAAAPFAGENWDRPQQNRLSRRDDLLTNRLPLLAPPVDENTYIFRQPVIARAARRASLQAESYVNQLPLKVGVVVPAPFAADDWPLPSRRPNLAAQGHLDQTRRQFIPDITAHEQGTTAKRRASLQAESKGSWTELLVPTPKAASSLAPTAARRISAQHTEPFIGALRFPVVAAAAPFIQTDWQAPARRRQALAAQITRLPHETETLGRGNQEHRIPVRRPIKPDQVINQIVLGVVAPVFPPPSETDWPNPARRAISQRGDVDRGTIRLPIEVPVRPVDMPLAKRRISQQAEPITAGALRLPAPVVGKPFSQADWPAASRLRRMVQSEIVVSLPLNAGVVNTFGQDDWPTAARTRRSASVDLIANRLPLTFVPPVVNPFVVTDWPLPHRLNRQGIPVDLLPLILSLTGGGSGTVTMQGGSGTALSPRAAEAAATDRPAGTAATGRGANTPATDRVAGTAATDRLPGTPAIPRQ